MPDIRLLAKKEKKTVSYTHLDVYKRQKYKYAMLKNNYSYLFYIRGAASDMKYNLSDRILRELCLLYTSQGENDT